MATVAVRLVNIEEDEREYFARVVRNYLEYCFDRETTPRVDELATRCGMSRAAFSRKFKRLLGVSPSQELKRRQLNNALTLIRAGLPTHVAAYRSGFGSRRTLFRISRRLFKTTPRKV